MGTHPNSKWPTTELPVSEMEIGPATGRKKRRPPEPPSEADWVLEHQLALELNDAS